MKPLKNDGQQSDENRSNQINAICIIFIYMYIERISDLTFELIQIWNCANETMYQH